jgi:uncharacterized protein with ATP-grasp and redox domains
MGVQETAKMFAGSLLTFEQAIAKVPPRPWCFDDLEKLEAQCQQSRWPRKAVVFADNAGADAVLGLLPLAREFVRRGAEVVIAANSEPSLNDVTAEELVLLLSAAAKTDGAFTSSSMAVVASGNAAPLIDLTRISDGLAEASTGSDLILLIGMGRGIESNWSAKFTCPCWTIAMIKDPQVAKSVGSKMYDAVCRVR